jgi:MFS family permease
MSQENNSILTKNFVYFLLFRFFTTIGMQMKLTIIGYFLYKISSSAISLGMLGLYEALPRIAMSLPAGYLVEQINKKKALLFVVVSYFILSTGLLANMLLFDKGLISQSITIYFIYTLVFLMGLIGSIGPSASFSIFSHIIPRSLSAKASAINSNSWQIGAIIGPILGGFSIRFIGESNAMIFVIFFLFLSILCILMLPNVKALEKRIFKIPHAIEQIKEGLHFVFHNKILLWAISLDLFAVLFGGSVALLPVFANDILHVGADGYGWLKSAMPIGAAISMLFLTRNPIQKNTGKILMLAVALFGLFTIGFALSTSFWISMIFLFLIGAFDAVSVVIRSTLLILETPENMKARVSSVNSMFISSSNEIGAFESGFAAYYMGTVRSVIFGGMMTLFFVGYASKKGKELFRFEFKNYS